MHLCEARGVTTTIPCHEGIVSFMRSVLDLREQRISKSDRGIGALIAVVVNRPDESLE